MRIFSFRIRIQNTINRYPFNVQSIAIGDSVGLCAANTLHSYMFLPVDEDDDCQNTHTIGLGADCQMFIFIVLIIFHSHRVSCVANLGESFIVLLPPCFLLFAH